MMRQPGRLVPMPMRMPLAHGTANAGPLPRGCPLENAWKRITLNEVEDQETSCHAPQFTTLLGREVGKCGGSLCAYAPASRASHRQKSGRSSVPRELQALC